MGVPMKKRQHHISFESDRRFGIEIELNSFDGNNRPPAGESPQGINDIAAIVSEASEFGCEVRAWEHTHNNNRWVAKPDSSCGLEVVSPPVKGWTGLKDVLQVVQRLSEDKRIKADSRCSVHAHLEVADLTSEELASVVAWWVKCEPVIMDAMPMSRKRNRYCQLIGMNNTFQHNGSYTAQDLIQRVGDVKYYSFNTHQYCRGNRKTIEFRTIEGDGCTDAYLVKQWVRFLIHFVAITSKLGLPKPYREPKNDDDRFNITPWTGLSWLDPEHVLTLLCFNNSPAAIPEHRKLTDFSLSKGMTQTRDWFLARLVKFMSPHKPGGMRHFANQQLAQVISRYEDQNGVKFNVEDFLSPSELKAERIFGDDSRY